MFNRRDFLAGLATLALGLGLFAAPAAPARADSAAELDAAAARTLDALLANHPVTRDMVDRAAGVMIFPKIVKVGLVVGGAGGDGVLQVGGETVARYRSMAVSYGLQAGAASFGYVMLLMDQAALNYVEASDGWEVGVGPNVTVADEGFAAKFSTTSEQSGIYVFFVGQSGYFAGAGIEGTKISRISD
ncbi:MAG: YSC84-related protein [Pseudomonadota bacterium]|nr:YSC84-related protein [Pseudomonadota bacterium]MEE3101226.1 YSC84-related protein [Pseudomonadota bacterium]